MERISAGVITCNEEETIGPLLAVLRRAEGPSWTITEIIVVSAECRDRTDATVKQHANEDARVRLISEPVRRGKSAAVNTFLAARSPSTLTLLSSGDVLLAPDFVDRLAARFADPKIGMAGGRPVPVNGTATLTGRMAHLMWDLHHDSAELNPKLGEAVMFRSDTVSAIPEDSPVDEASIEAAVMKSGLLLAYESRAVVHNRGPATLKEWLTQRRRIAFGHAWLEQRDGHKVSTGKNTRVLELLMKRLSKSPHRIPEAALLAAIELWARILSRTSHGKHVVWEMAPSTKKALHRDD